METLLSWVNATFAAEGAGPVIPPDPTKHLHGSRFRRTLAYFIVRRPRGLIAAALQYAHVSTKVTLSYADPRELHQMGEKSQVASSRRGPDRLRDYYYLAA